MGQNSGVKGVANIVILGRIGAPFGVKGWVHLHSFTSPEENILSYLTWQIRIQPKETWETKRVVHIRPHGKHFVAALEGLESKEEAGRYTNADIGVYREELPELPENEHYWTDLLGLKVINEEGMVLGVVDSLFETGANDVLIVKGEGKEHLIPYVPLEYILNIEKTTKTITVRWDPKF